MRNLARGLHSQAGMPLVPTQSPFRGLAHANARTLRLGAGGTAARYAWRRQRPSVAAFLWDANPLNIVTAPFVYSLAVPLVLADVWITLYQWICFPIYGIACVPRTDYFVLDRHRLTYLNAIEKVNCTYCSYSNGLIAYIREIAARTEEYWCPIKHGRRLRAPHRRYHRFSDYGDAEGYRARGAAGALRRRTG